MTAGRSLRSLELCIICNDKSRSYKHPSPARQKSFQKDQTNGLFQEWSLLSVFYTAPLVMEGRTIQMELSIKECLESSLHQHIYYMQLLPLGTSLLLNHFRKGEDVYFCTTSAVFVWSTDLIFYLYLVAHLLIARQTSLGTSSRVFAYLYT